MPQHVLRFWESRFAQIKPVKRAGGRRFYRPDDVDLLRGIRALLYVDGLTIRGVQKILKERGLRHVAHDRTRAGARALCGAALPKRRVGEKARGEEASQPFARGAVADEPAFLRCAGERAPASARAPVAVTGMAAGERAKLKALLNELEGLKKGLFRARRHAAI